MMLGGMCIIKLYGILDYNLVGIESYVNNIGEK